MNQKFNCTRSTLHNFNNNNNNDGQMKSSLGKSKEFRGNKLHRSEGYRGALKVSSRSIVPPKSGKKLKSSVRSEKQQLALTSALLVSVDIVDKDSKLLSYIGKNQNEKEVKQSEGGLKSKNDSGFFPKSLKRSMDKIGEERKSKTSSIVVEETGHDVSSEGEGASSAPEILKPEYCVGINLHNDSLYQQLSQSLDSIKKIVLKQNKCNIDKQAEYSLLVEESKKIKCSFSAGLEHFSKNRYSNVLPIDETRVKIGEFSEYINANRVSYKKSKFICTQAPLESTIPEFWRMVWDEKSPVICCLNKLIENGQIKGNCYWPEKTRPLSFGVFKILLSGKIELKEQQITIRIISLTKAEEKREIIQLDYCGWPDFGVPTDPTAITHMIHLMEYYREISAVQKINGPPIVHCSAGLGRSATYIAIAILNQNPLLESIESQKPVSNPTFSFIGNIVLNIRNQRNPGAVQTADQYAFVFSAAEKLKTVNFEKVQGNLEQRNFLKKLHTR